ncbi:CAP-Gly domain-containing linker protein 1 isoform X2 [Onthophagus taurus]|uniref:CAP-Gly domain-containing linker protein 1 isoform X2 n=1 Tax=Onthophagus taurus TaxID=166361 RepID=UPI000C20EEF7|nr:S phase cyclin A-associated protein in the endoplasmic reticulum isoform X2 [Onthophagus taurus]
MSDVASDLPTPQSPTEVRCQEKTRGGLCYEVIIGEPDVKAIPPKKATSPQNKNMSVQDIQDKLRAAEERRQQLEANKIASLTAKMLKIEEASRKKDEQTNQFISATREALEQKMETHLGKREAYITDLKTKLKDHIENVEKTRLTLEQQTEEVKTAIEEKLKSASAQRDENIKKMIERLREHEEQVNRVRTSNTEKFHQLDTAIQEKLEQAQNRREHIEQEHKEKLTKYNTRREEIKQTEEIRKTEFSAQIETKLSTAEQNREKELQKKLEAAKKCNERLLEVKQSIGSVEDNRRSEKTIQIESKLTAAEQKREKELQKKLDAVKKNEKRAETVRQNKANLIANQATTASSG